MNEQNIPIDINTTKLLDWLISRRHVNKDWQNSILRIREKINHAIQDMPEHKGIVKLLSGQHINYFHCLKIVEFLKETEADTKNLFGRYGSQRMKDWQEIVSAYQKDNVYLAEAAQMVMRNVSFEIPSLRKQVAKLEQQQVECEKKIKDYSKIETNALKEFNAACEQLGIAGKAIKSELLQLVNDLPKTYQGVSKKIEIVRPAVELYIAFVKFQSGKDNTEVLSLLKYLIEKGNTTTYEYMYGEKPQHVEEPVLQHIMPEKPPNTDEQIDFGDGDGAIDFGDFGGNDGNINFEHNPDTIDFGDNAAQIDFGNADHSPSGDSSANGNSEKDWSVITGDDAFEIVDHGDITLEESGIVVEKATPEGGVAKGDEAFTILDNPKTRNQIVNDLMELDAFLRLRLFEVAGESDLLAMSQMQDAPAILQMQTIETITSYSDYVHVALNELTNNKIQHLHNIKHSPKYVDILASDLNQKLSVVERMKASKKLLEEKIKELRREAAKVDPMIKLMIDKSKELQKQIQDDISKKYKGRRVNIVGGINML